MYRASNIQPSNAVSHEHGSTNNVAPEQVFDERHLVRLVLYHPRDSGGVVQLRQF